MKKMNELNITTSVSIVSVRPLIRVRHWTRLQSYVLVSQRFLWAFSNRLTGTYVNR